jgi:hypothetical protein
MWNLITLILNSAHIGPILNHENTFYLFLFPYQTLPFIISLGHISSRFICAELQKQCVSMNLKLRLIHYAACYRNLGTSNEVFSGYELHRGGMAIWYYESYILNPEVHYNVHKRHQL